MTDSALELYIHMCSEEPVIKWLKEEMNAKTRAEATRLIRPYLRNNAMTSLFVGGTRGVSHSIEWTERIINKHFKD